MNVAESDVQLFTKKLVRMYGCIENGNTKTVPIRSQLTDEYRCVVLTIACAMCTLKHCA